MTDQAKRESPTPVGSGSVLKAEVVVTAMIRWTVWERMAMLIERLDDWLHRHGGCPRWLCLLADVGYGWGPSAADWNTNARWIHRWLDKRLAPEKSA